ncbi:hypothetical protein SCHPADRAFT_202760 [Schizopora paradoxa]|uniref:DUF7330 domain-containing protein n=1 Tax=Schizopora paradoxa TaxID=27342 RepID=A0A0H2S4Q6_9AGAM|nr:hypothetical protein SCHPADRAFT_202760 [Schizopora paradoxa]
MIITKETDKQSELAAVAMPIPKDESFDVPPPYVQRASIPSAPFSSSSPSAQFDPSHSPIDPAHQLPDIPTSNFVSIFKRDGAIRQSFVIDTSLDVPQDLSPVPPPPPPKPATTSPSFIDKIIPSSMKEDRFALPENAPRPHLKLESRDGSINANVWLVHSEQGRVDTSACPEKEKAIFDIGTKDGSVIVKLHSLTEQKVSMRVWSKDGRITVYIPSSFVGPVNIYTGDGAIIPSAGVSKRLSTFAQHNKTQRSFLGDFKSAGYSDAASWNGSSLDILTKDGRVQLFYVEELDGLKPQGIMSKLLGSLMNV